MGDVWAGGFGALSGLIRLAAVLLVVEGEVVGSFDGTLLRLRLVLRP